MRGISAKLLAALLLSVTLPLAASALLLTAAVDSSFQVGVNRQVHEALERAPAAYRALFDALKSDYEHSTDAIAARPELVSALADGDADRLAATLDELVSARDDLVALVVLDGRGQELAAARREPSGPAESFRERVEERPLGGADGAARLAATWIAPRHLFDSFEEAGETLSRYETLEGGRLHVRNRYVAVYLAMVGFVLVLAVGVGVMLSRRVTKRIASLADATVQVAGGDLTTHVPEGPGDEVGQLAASFNAMVQRLHESRERIEYLQRVAAWQQLARRLAHEIKNPLTPIQLAVQELGDRYRGDDPAFERVLRQAIEIVSEEVEALRRLTTEFSAFAKLPEVDPQPVDLADFLEEAGPALELLATDRARVEVRPSSGKGLEVQVDRMMMRRALDNLVRNAVQAVEGSDREGAVTVSAGRARSGRPFVAVEDDGPGIPAEERVRVFEPYYTTKGEGTGLGLAIVKKIVLEHGGSVDLESRPGRGARFVVRFAR